MNRAFIVTLAIGTALLHDTGRRMEVKVLAPSRLEAACIAETHANCMVGDHEYVHARTVRALKATPPSGPVVAMALAA